MYLTLKLKRILATSGVVLAVGGSTLAATASSAMAMRTRGECDAHLAAGDYAASLGWDDWAQVEYHAATDCYLEL